MAAETWNQRPKPPNFHLLSWIWHLCAEQTQRLEALADGVDVCHPHEHHFTVGVIFCRERTRQREENNNYPSKRGFFFHKNKSPLLWTDEIICLQRFCKSLELTGYSRHDSPVKQEAFSKVLLYLFQMFHFRLQKAERKPLGIPALPVPECL